jgi:indolepyruvate ferredoxin oxidoreductase beta subunit
MSGPQVRPITLLIAALGGEGGGVLTDWIVAAASQLGFPVQSTSIPGVAQRTGATTYYIEIVPRPSRELGGQRPVLALAPGVGDVDIVLASELLEAGRAIAAGFVTPDRTLMIASTARSYLVVEKMAMGDGRYDSARITKAIDEHAQEHLLVDMEAHARQSGTMINAVMLGILAGCERLPISAATFEAAIRADGKAVDANLKGFRAGLKAVQEANFKRPHPASAALASEASGASAFTRVFRRAMRGDAMSALAELERNIATTMPAPAREVVVEGVRRLARYQSLAYAQLYLDRLAAIRAADERAQMGGRLLRETARHLAVRMSYEDVIRVAQAKIDPARIARIAAELGVKPGEPFTVTEFLKPGIEEMCSILPPFLATRILAAAERRGWLERAHWGMEVNTLSVSGFLRFWLLAKLRAWRPRSYRYREEQRAIEGWLALVADSARLSGDLALEVADCARLIKGYGDTHKRGSTNYALMESRIIQPALAGRIPVRTGIDAIASARTAALADPDGDALARCLAEVEQQATLGIAAE